ncbi:hypothetical protein U8C43_23875 [Sinorhizobium meliloti]|nr:hypothetical protein U8C30_23905 [Sinorhizobium meliloti]WQP28901.1 hypothetical protein U8C43_23875 [Sinorhizobium meliloti]
MNEVGLPKNSALASKVIEAQHTTRKMELGLMGKLFGGGSEKNGNIAATVLLASFVAIMTLLVLSAVYPTASLSQPIAGFFGIITTTVGYIFGRKTSE